MATLGSYLVISAEVSLDESMVVFVGRAGAQDILVSWICPKPCAVLGLPSGEESKGEVFSGWVFSCSHLIRAAGVWVIWGSN